VPWRELASDEKTGRRASLSPLAVSFAVGLALAACGGHTTTVATSNGTAKISSSANGKSNSVDVKSANGSARLGTGPRLPSGFPKSVPVPSGATLTGSITSTSKGKSVFELSYRLSGNLKAGLASYDAKLKGAGFTLHLSSNASGNTEQDWTSSTWNVIVTGLRASSTSSGKAGLTVVLTPRASTTTT